VQYKLYAIIPYNIQLELFNGRRRPS